MKSLKRQKEVLRANWHHGFTCFGGPAVQVQTFHDKFVNDLEWIDEPMYQQIFCLSQALPGSVSVKMLFCVNAIHGGMGAGLLASMIFCLPGAIGMYGLALGVTHIGSTLPSAVYALLSGLNAATVGIIALAAVRLATRAITDKVSRFLVYLSGIMGMLYTALWYYPVLLVGAGCTTLIWDLRYPHACAELFKRLINKRRRKPPDAADDEEKRSSADTLKATLEDKPLPAPPPSSHQTPPERSRPPSTLPPQRPILPSPATTPPPSSSRHSPSPEPLNPSTSTIPPMSWRLGTAILVTFALSFLLTTVFSILILQTNRLFSLFSSLYTAGTVIVGGGPVVIPLLQEYIVNRRWVTPRDFLLGLAVIQAFPGPNFNFAIYLGALAVSGTAYPSYVGAGVAFVGMYAPGVFIVVGFMGLWRIVQGQFWFLATLRGVNAAAIGLVFTAVYRLWQIGDLSAMVQNGGPLGADPWLVAIAGTAYVGGAWFGMSPPVAILLGGAMGVGRFGVVGGANGGP